MRLARRVNLVAIALMATARSALMVNAQIAARVTVVARARTVATARAVALEIVQTAVHVRSVTAMTAHALHVRQAKVR